MSLTKVKASNIVLTTAAASSNDTTPATTQYVTTALANLADSAPSTLNTLNELAAALGDDANFSTTVTNSIATKLPLAGGTLTGNLTVPYLATTSYIDLNNSGNRGKIGYDSNHVYIGPSSSVGSIIFKNNISSGGAPHSDGDTLLTIADAGNATFAGNVTSPRFILNGTNSAATRYIFTDNTNAGDGRLIIQSGGGSAGYGGSINLYSHSHSSKGGDVVAGLSTGSSGSFRVNTSGVDGGSDVFEVKNNGYAEFAGASDLRVTFGNAGTAGNNDANWVRGQSGTLAFNAASTGFVWEQGGALAMTLRPPSVINANNPQLELYNAHPWIDLKSPDGAYMKAGITARGGSSSTQGQFHLHITRDSSYRKLATAANYDAYLITETANTAYGNLRFGVDQTECIFIDAGTKGVAIVGGPTNNASSTYTCNSVLEVNGAGSQDCQSDGKLTVTKNASGDWSVQAIAGNDDYGFKTVGNGSYAFAVYNQPSSAYRGRWNYDGQIYLNGGSSAVYNINSDVRLKEDITDCPSQWDLVKGLPLQRFHWKDRREGDKWSYGFIAQEVEKTNPEFVEDVPDAMADTGSIQGDYKTVAEGQIHERALAALQEAMARIETLESEVAALKE